MLYNKVRYFILSLFSFYTLGFSLSAQEKHALLIGVGTYPVHTGWNQLHAENDVALLKNTLLQKEFSEQYIHTVLNEAATKQGILTAIDQHLKQQVKKGDIAVLLLSGHGQQLPDTNEEEIDGLDEAFVPYDSPKHFQKGVYEGANLLTDDELNSLLTSVRQKLGKQGQLLVLLDACHSGTGTRGYGSSRGTTTIMAAAEEKPRTESTKNTQAFEYLYQQQSKFEKTPKKRLAPLIALFGSTAQQLSYEREALDGQYYGALTYAFCQALLKADRGTNYATLFTTIQQIIQSGSYYQTPAIEGNTSLAIFNNQLIPTRSYFSILDTGFSDELKLNAGQLKGMHTGTKVGFYKGIKTKNSQPFLSGVISHANLVESQVLIKTDWPEADLLEAKVYIEQQSFGQLQLKLWLAIADKQLQQAIQTELATRSFISFDAQHPDLVLEQDTKTSFLQISTKEGFLLHKIPTHLSIEQIKEQLQQTLEAYIRNQFLRTLELSNADYQADWRLIKQGQAVVDSNLAVAVGDIIEIEITNQGSEGFYFSILDITPDNQETILIPYDQPAASYYLAPTASYRTDLGLEVGQPVGREVLKIICTPEPLELGYIIESRGSSNRALSNPLEVLLTDLFFKKEQLRGEHFPTMIDVEMGMVGSLIFEIRE